MCECVCVSCYSVQLNVNFVSFKIDKNSTLPVSFVCAPVVVLEDRSPRDCTVWHTSRQGEVSKRGWVSRSHDVVGMFFDILDFRTHSGSTRQLSHRSFILFFFQ